MNDIKKMKQCYQAIDLLIKELQDRPYTLQSYFHQNLVDMLEKDNLLFCNPEKHYKAYHDAYKLAELKYVVEMEKRIK